MDENDEQVLTDPQTRFLRKAEVIRITGLPASTIYEHASKGLFPKPVRISPRLSAWIESEVLDWQRRIIAARDKPTPPPVSA